MSHQAESFTLDFYWDINLVKGKNGAPISLPDDKITAFRHILKEEIQKYNESKRAKVKLQDVRLEKKGSFAKLILSVDMQDEKIGNMQENLNSLEDWIFSSLKSKGIENVAIFYDEESQIQNINDEEAAENNLKSAPLAAASCPSSTPLDSSQQNVPSLGHGGTPRNDPAAAAKNIPSDFQPTTVGESPPVIAGQVKNRSSPSLTPEVNSRNLPQNPAECGYIQTASTSGSSRSDTVSSSNFLKQTQCCAGTNVDVTAVRPEERISYEVKWKLTFDKIYPLNKQEVDDCRKAIIGERGKGINEMLKESEKLKGVICAVHQSVNVTNNSLKITFDVKNASCIPKSYSLSEVVGRCLSLNGLHKLYVEEEDNKVKSQIQNVHEKAEENNARSVPLPAAASPSSTPLNCKQQDFPSLGHGGIPGNDPAAAKNIHPPSHSTTLSETSPVIAGKVENLSSPSLSPVEISSNLPLNPAEHGMINSSNIKTTSTSGSSETMTPSNSWKQDQCDAGSNVDATTVRPEEDISCEYRWKLTYNKSYILKNEEVNACREAMIGRREKGINELLKESEKLKGVCVNQHCIHVTNDSLTITFDITNPSCIPESDSLSEIVWKCLKLHKLHKLYIDAGKEIKRSYSQPTKMNRAIDICLYIPEDLAKEIKSIEIHASKQSALGSLTRKGEMWVGSIYSPQRGKERTISYYYKLNIRKTKFFLFSKTDEVIDHHERNVCGDCVQRDILSVTDKPFTEEDKSIGLIAHISQMLEKDTLENNMLFHNVDNLMLRNNLVSSHWGEAFEKLLTPENAKRKEVSLLLLHCIQMRYLRDLRFLDENIANLIWNTFQTLEKDASNICKENVGHIFDIFVKAHPKSHSPLHFINGMQYLLDLQALCRALTSNPSTQRRCCINSKSCLKQALQFVHGQENEGERFSDILFLIFGSITEDEVLEEFQLFQNLYFLEGKSGELKEKVQRCILAKVNEAISRSLKDSKFDKLANVISKSERAMRLAVIAHCQKEVLLMLEGTTRYKSAPFFRELEKFCIEGKLFQKEEERLDILNTLLKNTSFGKRRDFVKSLLMNFEHTASEIAEKTVEKAYDLLLDTPEGNAPEEKIKQWFREYDDLSKKECFKSMTPTFQRKLLLKISNMTTTSMLRVHAEIENLDESTNSVYCGILKKRILPSDQFSRMKFLHAHHRNVETRGLATVFTLSLDCCDVTPDSTEEELLSHAIDKVSFWILIFGVEGKYKELVEEHPLFSVMKNIFLKIYSKLQNDMYDYTFLQRLKGDVEKKLGDIFLSVLPCSISDIQATFKDAFDFVDRACKDIKSMTSVLSATMCNLPESFHDIVTESIEYFKKIQEDLRSGSMRFYDFKNLSVLKNSHGRWEQGLMQSCRDVGTILQINSFWRSIDPYFNFEIKDVLDEEVQNSGLLRGVEKVQIIFAFISKECISRYKERMKKMIEGDILISQLYQLFSREKITAKVVSDELDSIEILLKGYVVLPSEKKCMIIKCLTLDKVSQKIVALKNFMKVTMSVLNEKYLQQIKDFETVKGCPLESKWSMKDTFSLILDMESCVINFSEEILGIITEYSNSGKLIAFLKEIMEEDIRNLMDAVEGEYFDQYLPLVSDLVEVKDLLISVLKLPERSDTMVFISKLQESLQKTEIQKSVVKIAQCSKELDSLKNFYKAFANKTEKTKDRIENIIENGTFHFKVQDQACILEIDCTDDIKYTASELSDLRSRALLIQNRFEKKHMLSVPSNMTESLRLFLEKVDTATEILDTFLQLKLLGHPAYECVDSEVEIDNLEGTRKNLSKVCDEWRNVLEEFRRKYSCMKYIKSEQLPKLFNYMKKTRCETDEEIFGDEDENIKYVLHYLHPDLNLSLVDETFPADDCPTQCLQMLVHSLEDNFKSLEMKGKSFPQSLTDDFSKVVLSRNLNFVRIDKDMGKGVDLILCLFLVKCNRFPLPSQVVVCSESTSWDELHLLLLRCREQSNADDQLFCIAFLELLPVEFQGKLVKEIEIFDRNNKSLALIYRGKQTDSIPTVFKDCEVFVKPFTRTQTEFLLQTMFSDVMVLISESPGLGKTEAVSEIAAAKHKGVKRLHVSGAYQRSSLIQKLKDLNLKSYEILHIEIGLMYKPEELDIFLFELLVLGYVSVSYLSYVLPQTTVAIEITNGANQMMSDFLPFTMCFPKNRLKWENYANYKCQGVNNSSIQVVGAYLKKLEKGELDIDIDLSTSELLNDAECGNLLKKYFPSFDGINFTIVDVFVSVLGSQLKKFSASTYFQTVNLSLMIGEENTFLVRKTILESLIQFSKEFALRSISTCRESQHRTVERFHTPSSGVKKALIDLSERTKGMIRWEKSNHLVVVFHSQDTQTVSAVYRFLNKVPENIKDMFQSQINRNMPDYASMESEKLLEIIARITRSKQKQLSREEISILAQGYAYTPDNMLKMMMIALRIQSNIPVVIMGETGCGKTSLIRKLALICEVSLTVLSVHAGTGEKEILSVVDNANKDAMSKRDENIWMFFDELNTSEDVGLISDIVCHRKLQGKDLSPNISFIAACNPYRLRETNRIFTKGLEGKQSEDALSLLAYRVHPLPEMMLDFVWDYGSLPLQEERAYIQRMVESDIFRPHENVLIQLLGASQQFVREKEGSSCTVSLRDVNRCILLIKWFIMEFIPEQHPTMEKEEKVLRSFILGLTVCYLCRFASSSERLLYRERMSAVFSSNFIDTYSEKEIAKCVRNEQNNILDKMDIPKGTARNTALQENVFVMLACILNRLPLFIVGKPGCSKSLSMQLIRNNMRGKDSENGFFRRYPRLYYSSFQGSESSTSDGIIKVFERAKKFEKQDSDVLSLVILDEIGLAEISRFNPLKVLHSLLEPDGKDRPEVAVVGISNWALDSAKMNRAIHLSRPDMTETELILTGESIVESVISNSILDLNLEYVAKAYLDYTEKQPIKNFHGLRDYYSFVKYISRELEMIQQSVNGTETLEVKKFLLLKGLLRNFGGQQINNDILKKTFCHRMKLDEIPMIETRELIMENILDTEARHLMLILDGDSALGSIENIVQEMNKDFTTILGSRFLDDQDDEYNYRVLNRIILCMEQPQVLILKDLDDIYGSLYDMLNQNYTIVQGKKHCRVALGPFSNPTCEVNDNFKCIVIIDESNIEKTDPPFLNRFEKQQYLLKDILKPRNLYIAENLEIVFLEMSSYDDPDLLFGITDAFPIKGKELFTSLVAIVEQRIAGMYMEECTEMQVFYYCIMELLWIMKPDFILRMDMSEAWTKCKRSLEFLITMYMSLPIHNGLEFYLKKMSEQYVGMSDEKDVYHFREEMKGKPPVLVPDELKELKEVYLSGIKDDDSAFDKTLDCLEGNMQILQEIAENEWKAPFAMEEEIDENDSYFPEALHDSDIQLTEKVSQSFPKQHPYILKQRDDFGAKMVVFTYSTIYCKVQDAVSEVDCVVHRLSEYKCEKNFTNDIDMFFEMSQRQFFVLQCDMRTDYQHILLAKAIIENSRKRLIKDQRKHVCLVIHITRRSNPLQMFNKINFSTGWALATLDSLEKTMFSLPDIYSKAILDILGAEELAFCGMICRELPWASSKLQYQGNTDNMIDVQEIRNSRAALNIISEQIQNWIRRHCDVENNMDWQHKAACDKHLLETSTTVIDTLGNHLSKLIQEPLARILYCIETSGILHCLLSLSEMKPELREMIHIGCESKEYYDVDAAPPPAGPGCYLINLTTNQLKVPFSKAVFRNLENFKSEVLGDVRRANIIPGYLQVADDEMLRETMLAIAHAYTEQIEKETELLDVQTFDHIMDDVKEDFCHYTTSTIDCRLSEEEKIILMKWILKNLIGDSQIYDVHSFLMTIHLWTWTYFQGIVGIFHLIDLWKTHDENMIAILQSNPAMNTNSISENLKQIVDSMCQELLNQCIELEKHRLENWQKDVYKFMTLIGEISVSSHKIETLKFLNDFMSVIFLPSKCDISPLNQFASFISHFDWNLVRLEVFKSLWQNLQSLKETEKASPFELQQITCSFVARCNVSNDSDFERESINISVIKLIGQGEIFDDSLQYFGHCLKLSIVDYLPEEDEDFESHLFLQILEKSNDGSILGEFLGNLHDALQTETVSPALSSILVSVLQDEVYDDVITSKSLEGIKTRNDFLICKMFQARNILKDNCPGLPRCAAVSYMKTFLSSIAMLICKRICQNNHLFYACDQVLCSATENKEERAMQKYFFECLQRNVGEIEVFKMSKELSESMQFFSKNTLLPTVEHLRSSVLSLNLARYCDDCKLSRLQTLHDISENNSSLMKIMDNDREYITLILCLLQSRVFHVESFSGVADFDHVFGKSVESAMASHRNSKLKLLIKHLLNQHVCDRRILKHDFDSISEARSLTIFLIHIVSLILINDSKTSILYRAAVYHEIPSCMQRKESVFTSFEIRNCECNHRIATHTNHTCPWCFASSKVSESILVTKPLNMNPFSSIVRAILIDAALVTTALFEDVIDEFGSKEVEFRETSLVSNWQRLCNSLQISYDELCQLLFIFLEKTKEIFFDQNFSFFEWNPRYDTILKEVLHERHHQLRSDDKRHKQFLASMISTCSEESDGKLANKSERALFHITEKPSIQNLYFELHLSGSANDFPCLNMIFENIELFQFPQYIEGILQWHRLLIGKCSYSLKKVDCKYMSAGSFINQQNKEIQRKLRECFKVFADTWEQIYRHIERLEHHTTKLPNIEKITEDSKLDLCVLKDKDSVLFQVLLALCSVQNKLLDKVLETCVNFNCKSLEFVQVGNLQAAIPVVPLMDLQLKHIVEPVLVDACERQELFAQCGHEKESRRIMYDFRKIEVEWAYKIYHNSAYIKIDETMMFMEFKDDLYGHCVQLLHKVSAQIPQTALDSTTETKVKERLDEDPSQVPQLLTVIGTVTTVIMRRKTIEKLVQISEFVERLEGLNVVGVSNKCLQPFKEYDLTLGKVVAFYTLLEEVNGEKYFSALDTEFRDAMQDRTKRQITAVINGRITLLKACESAMHVFLHRFLYIRDNEISLQQQIVDYLCSADLWKGVKISNQRITFPETDAEILLQDVFPLELQIKHVYCFLQLLKDQIKLHETRTHIPKMSFGSTKRSKKKALAGFF